MSTTKSEPLTPAQTEKFRRKLSEQQQQLQTQLRRLEVELTATNRDEEANDGYGDDAKQDQTRQRLVELIKTHRERLENTEAALLRIENGTYGIDPKTGAPISLARLEALPTAVYGMK